MILRYMYEALESKMEITVLLSKSRARYFSYSGLSKLHLGGPAIPL